MSDRELSEQLAAYRALTESNHSVDISALMLNALEKEQENRLSNKQKALAYFVSIGFPPFGLIFAIKFYFSNASDGKKTALICVVLTILTIFFFTMLMNIILSSSGASLQDLQQTPEQLRSLLQ